MSEPIEGVTILNTKTYEFIQDFNVNSRVFEKKIVVPGFGRHPFNITAKYEHTSNLGHHAIVTIIPEEGQNFDYEVRVTCNSKYNDVITRRNLTTKPLCLSYDYHNKLYTADFEIVFIRKDLETKPSKLAADLKTFLSDGPIVALDASDGEVTVPKMLLQIRSPVLKAMFTHDMEESKSSKIELKDFDSKTLQAFCDFLFTDEMDGDKTNALGLYMLADKYDVKGLKLAAQKFILTNLKDFDKEQVFDIFSKTNPELFIQLLETTYGN